MATADARTGIAEDPPRLTRTYEGPGPQWTATLTGDWRLVLNDARRKVSTWAHILSPDCRVRYGRFGALALTPEAGDWLTGVIAEARAVTDEWGAG